MSFPITIIPREKFSEHPLLARLLQLHEVPEQLYITGNLPDITLDEYGRATPRILSVVGSRKHSQYGKQAIEHLLASLPPEEVIVISGLAHGIDSIAHVSSLQHNIKTYAVLGNGLDTRVIYPSSHLHLAEEIVESGGMLISELPPLTQAANWTFPARNRIVAALSDAVLIVEAEEQSGTLITARLALELGRDIGAIPGEIFSPTSRGTHTLIRDGAYIIAHSDDLFSLLHLSKKETSQKKYTYSPEEETIMQLLTESKEKDLLLLESKLTPEKFLMTLSSLEIKGHIEEIFGEVRRIV